MILIIAEKPSLGRNIAAGIAHKNGNAPQTKRNGYIEAGEYLISWAFGHLFSLADIEEYSGEKPAAGHGVRQYTPRPKGIIGFFLWRRFPYLTVPAYVPAAQAAECREKAAGPAPALSFSRAVPECPPEYSHPGGRDLRFRSGGGHILSLRLER